VGTDIKFIIVATRYEDSQGSMLPMFMISATVLYYVMARLQRTCSPSSEYSWKMDRRGTYPRDYCSQVSASLLLTLNSVSPQIVPVVETSSHDGQTMSSRRRCIAQSTEPDLNAILSPSSLGRTIMSNSRYDELFPDAV
jgi:hypothetical protein